MSCYKNVNVWMGLMPLKELEPRWYDVADVEPYEGVGRPTSIVDPGNLGQSLRA